MVDALASEYGWDVEYVMSLPVDVVSQLLHALLARKGLRPRFIVDLVETPTKDLESRLSAIWGEIDKDT